MSSTPGAPNGPWSGWQAAARRPTGASPPAAPQRVAPSLDPSLLLPPAAQAGVAPGARGFAARTFPGGVPSVASMLPSPPGADGTGHAFRRNLNPPAWGAPPVAEGNGSPATVPFRPRPQSTAVPFRPVAGTVPPVARPARAQAQSPPQPGAYVPFR